MEGEENSHPASSSPEVILSVSPTELNFPPPLNRVITNCLKLKNTSAQKKLSYKVKTTAPKRYCVKPNIGYIGPNSSVEVQVLLNCNKDPPTSLKCKDKFQIQHIVLDDSYKEGSDLRTVWSSAKKDQILKQKLKCSFSRPKEKKSSPTSSLPVQAPSVANCPNQTENNETEGNKEGNKDGDSTPTIVKEETNKEEKETIVSPTPKRDTLSWAATSGKDYVETEKLKGEIAKLKEERDKFSEAVQKLKSEAAAEKASISTLRKRKESEVTSELDRPAKQLPQHEQPVASNSRLFVYILLVIVFLFGIWFGRLF